MATQLEVFRVLSRGPATLTELFSEIGTSDQKLQRRQLWVVLERLRLSGGVSRSKCDRGEYPRMVCWEYHVTPSGARRYEWMKNKKK